MYLKNIVDIHSYIGVSNNTCVLCEKFISNGKRSKLTQHETTPYSLFSVGCSVNRLWDCHEEFIYLMYCGIAMNKVLLTPGSKQNVHCSL